MSLLSRIGRQNKRHSSQRLFLLDMDCLTMRDVMSESRWLIFLQNHS